MEDAKVMTDSYEKEMINTLVVSGELLETPVFKTTNAGNDIAEFYIINHSGRDSYKRSNQFFCRIFGKRVQELKNELVVGSFLTCVGRIENEKWVAKDGGERSKWVVNCFEVLLQ